MSYTDRVTEAFAFSMDLHKEQTRKGSGAPYVSHLWAVAALVAEYGGDEDQVIGALLHDAAEDQGGHKTLAEIRRRFGATAAGYVEALSDSLADTRDGEKEPWQVRKDRYLEHLARKPPAAKLLCAADKLHNIRCTARDLRAEGQSAWDKFNATREQSLWYYNTVVQCLAQDWDHPILDELRFAITQLESADKG